MPKLGLGILEKVNIKEIFESEDRDFTPWLKENLNILGKELNIDIIDGETEQAIGNFRCDIVAHDSDSGRIIVIENQFGSTDHDHLGKILTYSAGKQATIVIWIAENFREEHKRTLEWLNEIADPQSGISFFGVEIQFLKIGNSPPAPYFKIVVSPNNWERQLKTSNQKISETSRKYEDFYSRLVKKFKKLEPSWREVKPLAQNWLNFGAGKSGLYFSWAFRSNNKFSVGLYIDTGNREKNKEIFEKLKSYKNEIESKLPGLSWEKMEESRACRIAIYKENVNIKNLAEEKELEELVDWAAKTMKKFKDMLTKYIRRL